jgi:hypothetical protein
MLAVVKFLEVLGALVLMKNGGQPNDLSRLINYARLGARAGDKGREYFEAATAKVKQLVDEDRSLTEQEIADLNAQIRGKLARAAGVEIPADPERAGGTDPE